MAHLVEIAHILQTPISYFFADCVQGGVCNDDELDGHWQALNYA
ncbi:MAG: hypothetical protein Q3971_05085 [Moraxella sp.]|nr:hypothetical protein [Moraxella sp.]